MKPDFVLQRFTSKSENLDKNDAQVRERNWEWGEPTRITSKREREYESVCKSGKEVSKSDE